MAQTNTSDLLLDSMDSILRTWCEKFAGASDRLCCLLRAKTAEVRGADVSALVAGLPDASLRSAVSESLSATGGYWDDIRYSSLEPVTMLWGTIVNSLRVAADSARATDMQKKVFAFPRESLVTFFRAARERMEVADGLHQTFRAMPAPECQAMAALLNVHVDGRLDAEAMCRLVRLLDHEGPMSPAEKQDLTALASTQLIHATFRGLRGSA